MYFTTLLMKELRETMITGKFIIAALLCLILIPVGLYVTLQDYTQRNNNYRRAEQLYQERSEGKVNATFKAEGYRPPSPLSVFAVGLEPLLPNKAVTSRRQYIFRDPSTNDGVVAVSGTSGLSNPLSVLFGKIDFAFNVGFVLSIFAFLFTFAGVTAEKEQGTLKLIMSNSLQRWTILLAKITGNFIIFLLPFLLSFLIGLIVLILSGVFPLTDPGIMTAIVLMFAVSVVFLFCMFTFGMLVSALTRHSITSIITLLFLWVLFALVIPKLSPMAAQIIRPVESEDVVNLQIKNIRADLEKELNSREDEIFGQMLGRYGYTLSDFFKGETREGKTAQRQSMEEEYEAEIAPVREEYAEKIANETARLQRTHKNAIGTQQSIAIQLSRLSPISCFTYILTDLASTGMMEIDNFIDQAERFQEQVTADLYSKFTYRQYGTDGRYSVGFHTNPGVDQKTLPVPHMTGYRTIPVRDVFGERWPDMLLLVLYTVLFFALAFVRFLRYDVR